MLFQALQNMFFYVFAFPSLSFFTLIQFLKTKVFATI